MSQSLVPNARSITVNGVEQHYRVAGKGPFCIVHAGGPGIDVSYLRLPLLEPHLTMVYLDPIGTGTSGCLPSHPMGYRMEKRDASQTCVCVTKRLSGSIGIEGCHRTRHAIYAPHLAP